MKFVKENWFKILISIILVIGLLIFALNTFILSPSRENQRLESERYEEQRQKTLSEMEDTRILNDRMRCLAKAEQKQHSSLEANTRDYSDMRVPLGEGTYIPTAIKESINKEFKDDQDYCFRLYPDNK